MLNLDRIGQQLLEEQVKAAAMRTRFVRETDQEIEERISSRYLSVFGLPSEGSLEEKQQRLLAYAQQTERETVEVKERTENFAAEIREKIHDLTARSPQPQTLKKVRPISPITEIRHGTTRTKQNFWQRFLLAG